MLQSMAFQRSFLIPGLTCRYHELVYTLVGNWSGAFTLLVVIVTAVGKDSLLPSSLVVSTCKCLKACLSDGLIVICRNMFATDRCFLDQPLQNHDGAQQAL